MRPLVIEPPVPFLLPDAPLTVAVVGCGGTGSAVAQHIARIAAHLGDASGRRVSLILIDGDSVAPANIGRQLFAHAEIGQNKAQTLAARLSRALAIPVHAVAEMATVPLLQQLRPRPGHYGLLVGAVDGASGRQVLQHALGSNMGWRLWLDCGNHEHSGQVAVGSVTCATALQGAFALTGVCTALPSPALVYPDLLQAAPVPSQQACAADMIDGRQSLLINHLIAAIAAQYVSDLVLARRITRWQTIVDAQSLTMRSIPITAAAIAAACSMPLDALTQASAVVDEGVPT